MIVVVIGPATGASITIAIEITGTKPNPRANFESRASAPPQKIEDGLAAAHGLAHHRLRALVHSEKHAADILANQAGQEQLRAGKNHERRHQPPETVGRALVMPPQPDDAAECRDANGREDE